MAQLNPGQIFVNNQGQQFKIIKEVPHLPNSHDKRYLVRFLESNYEKEANAGSILNGSVRDYSIDSSKTYTTKSGHPYHILNRIGTSHMVRIRFDETGYENIVKLTDALKGFVGARSLMAFDPNKIYMSYLSGPFRVIRRTDKRSKAMLAYYEIEFLNTGNHALAKLYDINIGNVSDPGGAVCRDINLVPQEYYDIFIEKSLYNTWSNMLDRCYNPKSICYSSYGGIGVTVQDSWRESYQNFKEDVKEIPQYDKFTNNFYMYDLDKDYKQLNVPKEKRIYSKDTCMFLHYYDNLNLRHIEARMLGVYKNKYYGVHQDSPTHFVMHITCNNYDRRLGFNNEIAAANAYNYWQEVWHTYDILPLINNVPYMPPEEWTKYLTYHKMLYNVVNDNDLNQEVLFDE